MAKSVKTVYGNALFELAKEENQTETIADEISMLLQILEENPGFYDLIENPQIDGQEKEQLLESAFKGRISDMLFGFLQLLKEKNHFRQLPDACACYMDCYRAFHNIGAARITSPSPLTDSQKEKITKKLLETTSFTTIEPEYVVDPSIIGGIIIRIGDRVVDGSVRNKLERLTNELNSIQLKNEQ